MLPTRAFLCLASGAGGFNTGFVVAAISILISLVAIVCLIVFGVRRKKRWLWWVSWTVAISLLYMIVSTYSFEIMQRIVYPFLTRIGW